MAFYLHTFFTHKARHGTLNKGHGCTLNLSAKKWEHIKILGRLNGFPEMHLLQILLDSVHPRP